MRLAPLLLLLMGSPLPVASAAGGVDSTNAGGALSPADLAAWRDLLATAPADFEARLTAPETAQLVDRLVIAGLRQADSPREVQAALPTLAEKLRRSAIYRDAGDELRAVLDGVERELNLSQQLLSSVDWHESFAAAEDLQTSWDVLQRPDVPDRLRRAALAARNHRIALAVLAFAIVEDDARLLPALEAIAPVWRAWQAEGLQLLVTVASWAKPGLPVELGIQDWVDMSLFEAFAEWSDESPRTPYPQVIGLFADADDDGYEAASAAGRALRSMPLEPRMDNEPLDDNTP